MGLEEKHRELWDVHEYGRTDDAYGLEVELRSTTNVNRHRRSPESLREEVILLTNDNVSPILKVAKYITRPQRLNFSSSAPHLVVYMIQLLVVSCVRYRDLLLALFLWPTYN
jgi:hypothetical protein